MKFGEYLKDDYRSQDFIKTARINLGKRNVSGVAAPIEMYDDPLDPSKTKTKTKKIMYGFSMGLYHKNR